MPYLDCSPRTLRHLNAPDVHCWFTGATSVAFGAGGLAHLR